MYGDICSKSKTNTGVYINNLEKIIDEKSKKEDDGFKQEYQVSFYAKVNNY